MDLRSFSFPSFQGECVLRLVGCLLLLPLCHLPDGARDKDFLLSHPGIPEALFATNQERETYMSGRNDNIRKLKMSLKQETRGIRRRTSAHALVRSETHARVHTHTHNLPASSTSPSFRHHAWTPAEVSRAT